MILDFPTENLPHSNIVPGIDYLSINFWMDFPHEYYVKMK